LLAGFSIDWAAGAYCSLLRFVDRLCLIIGSRLGVVVVVAVVVVVVLVLRQNCRPFGSGSRQDRSEL
jgi:hypothetical protein